MRPVLFSLGSVDFFASPVFAGFSSILAAVYIHRFRDRSVLNEERYWHLMLWLAFGTLGAGVLTYFLLYGGGWERNLQFLLKYRRFKGGAFYGNYWGAILTVGLFSLVWKLPFRKLADIVASAAPLALSLMRFGCIQHGCCFGKPTDLPWAFVFSHPRSAVRKSLLGTPLHPSQAYEAVGNLAIFLVVHFFVLKRVREGKLPDGYAFLASTALYAILRLTLGIWRGSDPGIFTPFGLTTAQCIAIVCLAATAILARRWRRA
jgi:phosphatidylglycerol:prolipoprotein diacylglycerol transferase